jgi:Sulfotransferase family
MPTRYLNIEARQRPLIPSLASLSDFTVSDGEAVDAEIVLKNPGISLYCLDDASQQAIFVGLPPDIDLTAAPFVYQTQFDHAQRLIAMPYDTFRELGHTLPEIPQLILIFSVPRSGTTLMSHILNQLDSVISLSEPDAASQFYQMRPTDSSRDAELIDLIDCTMRMLFRSTGVSTTATAFCIKFRAEATEAMDLYHAAFPQARNLFLYRDTVGVVASLYRIYLQMNLPTAHPVDEYLAFVKALGGWDFRPMLQYLDPGMAEITVIQQLTLVWINYVEQYLHQQAHEIPTLVVRYADLNGKREQTLAAIFKYCGLPVDQVEQSLVAFEQDSQANTILAREKPTEGNAFRLTSAQIEEIKAILEKHPVINTPNFVLPGTLEL